MIPLIMLSSPGYASIVNNAVMSIKAESDRLHHQPVRPQQLEPRGGSGAEFRKVAATRNESLRKEVLQSERTP
jgi:hypothetical protein